MHELDHDDVAGSTNILLNTITQAVAEAGAKEIGYQYHGTADANGNVIHNISQSEQLALHGVLGAGISAANGMITGDGVNTVSLASGAAAGVIGEIAADSVYQEGQGSFSRDSAIQIGSLSGSVASLFSSAAMNADDQTIAQSIQNGAFIGGNAAANNATYVNKNNKVVGYTEDEDNGIYEVTDSNNLNKNNKVGYSTTLDQFAGYAGYKDGVYIQDDLSFNQNAFADAITQNLNPIEMGTKAFVNDGPLDLKQQLMISGTTNSHLDGLVVNHASDGLPIYSSVESVVNYSVGRAGYLELKPASTLVGATLGAMTIGKTSNIPLGIAATTASASLIDRALVTGMTGLYNQKQNNKDFRYLDYAIGQQGIGSQYMGETPYAGQMIQQGINSAINTPESLQPKFINQQGRTDYQSMVNQYLTIHGK